MFTWLVALFLVPTAHAGFDKGNGGDGFHCPTRTPSYLLAEEVEAAAQWQIELLPRDWQLAPRTVEQAAQDQIAEIALMFPQFPQFPQFAKRLQTDFLWVTSNRVYVYGATLDNLNDDVLAWVPSDCSLEQVAIQTPTEVLIDGNFWKNMDARTQSMLLTHEALYRTLDRTMSGTLATSQSVRMFNSFLWRDPSKISKSFDLVRELAKLGVINLK
ncbi:hypothetical protein BH10BDE1_BH10BDE1_17830 [soil metagenome]